MPGPTRTSAPLPSRASLALLRLVRVRTCCGGDQRGEAEWRRVRGKGFYRAITMRHEQRRMARADDAGVARLWIQRHAHRRHERTRAEDAAEIAIDRLHDFHRLLVFVVRVME